MPTPVSIVGSGGAPIVNTPLGTPMTPVEAPLYGMPVTIVESPLSGIPIHLVNEDLSDWGFNAADLLAGEDNGLALDFRSLTAAIKDTTTPANNFNGNVNSKLTYTSPSTKWIRGANGLFSSGTTLRCEYDANGLPLGLLVERQRVNVVLHNRDLSNVAWVKTNVTAAKDQIGIDGASNSASSITATANGGTILQAITLASSARFQTAFVKRLVGSGALEMTMDNGSTWTAVPVTADWARVEIPTQALANPTVGFRIGTNGDSFAIDFSQNENGTYASSPIATTTVAVTRVFDNISLAINLFPLSSTEATLYAWAETSPEGSGCPIVMLRAASQADSAMSISSLNGGTVSNAFSVSGAAFSVQASITFTPHVAGAFMRLAGRAKSNDFHAARDGSLGTADTSGTFQSTAFSVLNIGSIGSNSGVHGRHIREIIYLPHISIDAELQELSLPKPGRDSAEIAASVHLLGDSFLNSGTSDGIIRSGLTNKICTITKDGVGGSDMNNQKARFLATPRFWPHILLWVDGGLSDSLAQAQASLLAGIAVLPHDRWLIMQGSPSSSVGLTAFHEWFNWVATNYPIHYVETLAAMQALSTGSANDLADIAAGLWPRSATISEDGIHPTATAELTFFGQATNKILANGW